MKINEPKYIDKRANGILNVIMAYARLEFNEKTPISANQDVFDLIGAGVNMLGEELENSVITIRERESLLKEVHHRVKNNLQIVSSLLNLQATYSEDERFLNLIRECRNRIITMAMIHEMLYKSKDLSKINASEYIRNLCSSLQSSFYSDGDEIEFSFNLDRYLELDTDIMIPVGLILNEIVSNSYKYAFSKKQGVIKIVLSKTKQQVHLKISDNGCGFSKEVVVDDLKTLGLQLIFSLVEQLNGTIDFKQKDGAEFNIAFNVA